eukprot:evm.model.NODE_6442_length_21107_cov_24.898565.5
MRMAQVLGSSSSVRHRCKVLHFFPTLLLPSVIVLALLLLLFPGAQSFVPQSPLTFTSERPAMSSSCNALAAAGCDGSGSSHGKESLLNPLLSSVAVSKTIEIHAMTKNMEARGEAVVSLCVGEPDFAPPAEVIEATIQAVREGHTRYTAVTGEATLRAAICKDLETRKGIKYAPEEIIVGNGAKQEVYQAVLALCRPGDEVIIPAPYWPSYPEIVKLAGATPVILETKAADGFLVDPEALSAAITPKTRMFIFCNPSNPTGAVHPPSVVDAVGAILKRPHAKHVWALSDEIYERIVYDTPHKSLAAVSGLRDRVLLINGFSKAFAMTGYRLGYLAGPLAVIKGCTTLQSQITSCASSIAQRAGTVALGLPEATMAPSVAVMRKKRDQVMAALAKIPRVTCSIPQGAFYVLPDISAYYHKTTPAGKIIRDGHELCMYLLKEYKVALVPGDSFGDSSTIRISYATSEEELNIALTRLGDCLASLS